MLEHAIYSVISPEGAASILWRDPTRAKDAATNMKITAQDLLGMKVIDGIVPEPLGGAHRAPEAVIAATGEQIDKAFVELAGWNVDYRAHRREKSMAIGRALKAISGTQKKGPSRRSQPRRNGLDRAMRAAGRMRPDGLRIMSASDVRAGNQRHRIPPFAGRDETGIAVRPGRDDGPCPGARNEDFENRVLVDN